MHIDSKWKFKEMIQFRDEYAKKYGWNLIVESNMEVFNAGVGLLRMAARCIRT